MLTMIGRRLLVGLAVVWASTTAVFVVLHLIPGNPVDGKLGGAAPGEDVVDALSERFGVDDPLLVQYRDFIVGLLHGDLGTSFTTSQPVGTMLADAIPWTVWLTIASLTFGIVVGLVLGTLCAIRPDSPLDHGIQALTSILVAMPVFWTGMLLQIVFSYTLHLLPSLGGDGFVGVILPALSLGLASAAVLTRVTRASLVDSLASPHFVVLRASGMPRPRILAVHAARGAIAPVVAMAGLQLGEAFAGAVVIETLFNRAGIGRLLATGILGQDYPLVQGIMVFLAAGLVLVNIVVDISQAMLDPRIRTAGATL